MRTKRKGDFNLLIEFALLIAVVSIVSIMIFNVNSDARDDLALANVGVACGTNATGGTTGTILYTNCGYGYNATNKADEALYKIPSNLKLLATAVVFGVVLYVIFRVIPMAGVNLGNRM